MKGLVSALFSPKPCKSLEFTHLDREMLNLYLVMVSFPTNSTEALLFPCEEVVGADGMGMEWALLSHKMRKSLELVPDV